MMKKYILAGLCLLAVTSLLLAACSPQQPTTQDVPTIDTNAIYTQAAETVQAGISMTEAARPTATVTETPAPTFTMDPAMAQGMTATANAVLQPPAAETPGGPTATQSSIVVLPATATRPASAQAPAATTGDLCEWVSNNPTDNAKIPKNASFDANIRVKNSGTTTWDNRYALRFYAGDRMGVPTDFYVTGEVKPGSAHSFVFPMKAPDATGKKEVLMVVQNPDGRNMCFINLPLEITE
jgi:hypothetical protein